MQSFFHSFFTVSLYTFLSRILGFLRDIFIAKYNSSGQYDWAILAGSEQYYDESYDVSVDSLGDIYITGYF